MEQIATSLMFVGEQAGKAEEAVNLYVSLFDGSRILDIKHWGPDEGDTGVKQAHFELAGREFTAMDSGAAHNFSFTPSVSLTVRFDDVNKLDSAFEQLSNDGQVLMPLGEYPFSPRFGWVNDRYGVSWQVLLA